MQNLWGWFRGWVVLSTAILLYIAVCGSGVRYVDKQQWPVVVVGIDGKLQELLGVQPLPKATARLASNQIPRKISPLPLEIPPQVSMSQQSCIVPV